MNLLADYYKLYIFEMKPKQLRVPGKVDCWKNVQQGKQVPSAFARTIMLTTDIAILSITITIDIVTHGSALTIAALELFYVAVFVLLLVSRAVKQFLPVLGSYFVIVGLAIILNLVFPGMWGSFVFYVLCVNLMYRFPPEWSLPLAAVCLLALIASDGAFQLLLLGHPASAGMLLLDLALLLRLVLVWVDTSLTVFARGTLTRSAGAVARGDEAQRGTGY